MDKISVIIPCYNVASTINKCLDSVISQTYGIDNLEIICVNDASTDGTFDILCEYESNYSNSFLIINNEQNTKQGYARNLAIQYSTGEYILFIDSDDYVDNTLIEKLYSQMSKSDYDYVSCNYLRVNEGIPYVIDDSGAHEYTISDREQELSATAEEYLIDTDELRKSFILNEGSTGGCWATLYRRSFICNNELFFAEGIVYEDLLWLGMVRFYANHVSIIPDRLYYYVNYNDSSVVVKQNSPHHFDRLNAMKMYLNECRQRELDKLYKAEIEFHFIWIYYVNSLTLFARRFTVVSESILNDMCRTIINEIPDYKENPHILKCEGISASLLSLIEKAPITQAGWNEIMNVLRDI